MNYEKMKKPNKKILPFIIALFAVLIFHILRIFNIIQLECTVSYLNPWQLAFSCMLFYLPVYAGIFLIVFFIGTKINRN